MPGGADNAEAIRILIDRYQHVLTTWECDFLESIQGLPSLSLRQQNKLDEIFEEIVARRRRD